MTEEYVVKPVSLGVARIQPDFALEPVAEILRSTTQTRLVFRAEIHNGGVRGKLIHQKKGARDQWEDAKDIDLTRLRNGEGVHLELKTAALARLVEVWDRLQAHLQDHGVPLGARAYVSGRRDEVIVTDANMAEFVRQLLDQELACTFLRDLSDSDPTLVNWLAYGAAHLDRMHQLDTFRALLDDDCRLTAYANCQELDPAKREKVWQHFFEKNSWIFGYGLDYKYLRILQREASIGAPTFGDRDQEFLDFLMGSSEFTVLVELKTPGTPLFGKRKNRSGSWRLSHDLIDAESQILEQTASLQEFVASDAGKLYGKDEMLISQKTLNPAAILIIGSQKEFLECQTDRERVIKERTFELHRRGLANLQILRFDELYDRASHIVAVGERDAASRQAAPVIESKEEPHTTI